MSRESGARNLDQARLYSINLLAWGLAACLGAALTGCRAPVPALTFPRQPLAASPLQRCYDTNHDGRADFALTRHDESLPFDTIEYDDDQDGRFDRTYRLSDYDPDRVPHLLIMLDSIPYQAVAQRYRQGGFGWFPPPQKLIAPFPSMTELCFTQILHAPPLLGMIDDGYDRRTHQYNPGIRERIIGYQQPWEYRCHYAAPYWENGIAYLRPRVLFHAELKRVREVFERSPDRSTRVYFVSTSGMLGRYGQQGLDEVLDEIERLCLQLLFEREGAIKISLCSDHGHNLVPSTNIQFDEVLKQAGFRVTDRLRKPEDVVIDRDGLVTYLGMHTCRPVELADAILTCPQVELVAYLQQDRVIVRDQHGQAAIEYRDGRYRYTPVTADVLGYQSICQTLGSQGKMDADGFIADADWFAATVDAPFPDAPWRLWQAFHGMSISPPTVMITLHDGYCSGYVMFSKIVDMRSTHGGLNQVNSAAFVLSMTGRATRPLRSRELIPTIEPAPDRPQRLPR